MCVKRVYPTFVGIIQKSFKLLVSYTLLCGAVSANAQVQIIDYLHDDMNAPTTDTVHVRGGADLTSAILQVSSFSGPSRLGHNLELNFLATCPQFHSTCVNNFVSDYHDLFESFSVTLRPNLRPNDHLEILAHPSAARVVISHIRNGVTINSESKSMPYFPEGLSLHISNNLVLTKAAAESPGFQLTEDSYGSGVLNSSPEEICWVVGVSGRPTKKRIAGTDAFIEAAIDAAKQKHGEHSFMQIRSPMIHYSQRESSFTTARRVRNFMQANTLPGDKVILVAFSQGALAVASGLHPSGSIDAAKVDGWVSFDAPLAGAWCNDGCIGSLVGSILSLPFLELPHSIAYPVANDMLPGSTAIRRATEMIEGSLTGTLTWKTQRRYPANHSRAGEYIDLEREINGIYSHFLWEQEPVVTPETQAEVTRVSGAIKSMVEELCMLPLQPINEPPFTGTTPSSPPGGGDDPTQPDDAEEPNICHPHEMPCITNADCQVFQFCDNGCCRGCHFGGGGGCGGPGQGEEEESELPAWLYG